MANPKMDDDLEIISKLGDIPGSDDGLSTQQLKNLFDRAGLLIKNYINTILIPKIESSVDEDSLLPKIANELNKKLSLSGGTMTGGINMNSKSLYNLKNPLNDADAAHKKYVDDAEIRSKEYTDSRHFFVFVTLSANNWTGSSAPYIQTVTAEDILAEDNPHYTVVYSDVQSEQIEEKESFACIDDLTTEKGKVSFTCFEDKPLVDLNIQMEVNR